MTEHMPPLCQHCGRNTVVKDTRRSAWGTRRRRYCMKCKTRRTTIEVDYAEYKQMLRHAGSTKGGDNIAEVLRKLAAELDGGTNEEPRPIRLGVRADMRGGVA